MFGASRCPEITVSGPSLPFAGRCVNSTGVRGEADIASTPSMCSDSCVCKKIKSATNTINRAIVRIDPRSNLFDPRSNLSCIIFDDFVAAVANGPSAMRAGIDFGQGMADSPPNSEKEDTYSGFPQKAPATRRGGVSSRTGDIHRANVSIENNSPYRWLSCRQLTRHNRTDCR